MGRHLGWPADDRRARDQTSRELFPHESETYNDRWQTHPVTVQVEGWDDSFGLLGVCVEEQCNREFTMGMMFLQAERQEPEQPEGCLAKVRNTMSLDPIERDGDVLRATGEGMHWCYLGVDGQGFGVSITLERPAPP